MQRSLITLAGLALLLSSCTTVRDATQATSGGSVLLDSVLADEPPFYDTNAYALIDARLVESEPLDSFQPPSQPDTVVGGSVTAIGSFLPPRLESLPAVGPLRVGTWDAVDDAGARQSCFGFHNGDSSSGSRCTDAPGGPDRPAEVYWELTCEAGTRDRWLAFTIDPRVVALRFDVADDVSVVGHDPGDVGLVAVEAIGTVTRATAQGETGEVWTVDISAAACPVG